DIRDRINLLQGIHDQLANLLRWDVTLSGGLKLADDPVDDALDALLLHRTFIERDADGTSQLVAVEWYAAVVGFHHCEFAQLGPLDRGEALATMGTEAPAPDRAAVLTGTAVLHLGVLVAAEWAAHRRLPCAIQREAGAKL